MSNAGLTFACNENLIGSGGRGGGGGGGGKFKLFKFSPGGGLFQIGISEIEGGKGSKGISTG
uniref:Candidate secreted effector n=1 Tax=Meloidogyne incognita TaxID=6306 RepID=A0A914KPG4_MELIC